MTNAQLKKQAEKLLKKWQKSGAKIGDKVKYHPVIGAPKYREDIINYWRVRVYHGFADFDYRNY